MRPVPRRLRGSTGRTPVRATSLPSPPSWRPPPPLPSPAPVRPVIGLAGAALARRFLAAYRQSGGAAPDPQALDWYTSLHALRILIELRRWQHDAQGPDRSFHPWMVMEPIAAQILTRTMKTKRGPGATRS